jgi:hypothetical protein
MLNEVDRRIRREAIAQFLAHLEAMEWANATNPYRMTGAAEKPAMARLDHLTRYFDHFIRAGCSVMFVAEAFGYRGGRVTGIPLASERIIRSNPRFAAEFPDIVAAYRPCEEMGSRDTEATATIVWRVFEKLPVGQAPLCWNVFPAHPYQASEGPWSNRPPTRSEIERGAEFARQLVQIMKPQTVVAIGRCAERGLAMAGIPAIAVRHPSNGGGALFVKQVTPILFL